MGKGGFVDEQISPLGQGHSALAEHRVGAIHNGASRLPGPAELAAIDAPPVGKGDGFSGFEARKLWPWRQPHRFGLGNVKAAWALALLHPIAKGRHPVFERCAADAELPIDEQGFAAVGR